ncbi:hypothetical protein CON72_14105 [Bacillus wiedmannii]|nr:hypothetical protein CON72_14105 [Bacillus wiedmannii]
MECVTYILQKNNVLVGRTGGSAGIIKKPSRITKFLVFGLIGLAKDKPLPKKIPQGWSKAKRVEIF